MSIRKKILLYFSIFIPAITAVAFLAIYILSYQNREDVFQMRQKDKITTTLEILSDIKTTDEEIIEALDRISINEMFDDKLLLFNQEKELIYSNIVDTPVPFSKQILSRLNEKNKWIEVKEGLYDVIGAYVERNGKIYYGISKAYDDFGYSKLNFLKYILIFTFLAITIIVILVSFYISKKISTPLIDLTRKISSYDPGKPFEILEFEDTKDEIAILARVFNDLMKRLNDVFAFQKHTIHHISHELKTPIAILVSNFERIEKEKDPEKQMQLISHQKEDTKNLSEIINSLLEIAKIDTGKALNSDLFRVDELVFDVSDKLSTVFPDFVFSIQYAEPIDQNRLMIGGNKRLFQTALTNLMENCIRYSSNKQGSILIDTTDQLRLTFENEGKTLSESETNYLFKHFFRGENSQGKRGFGLGLVLVQRIIDLHQGQIAYSQSKPNTNQFIITLP